MAAASSITGVVIVQQNFNFKSLVRLDLQHRRMWVGYSLIESISVNGVRKRFGLMVVQAICWTSQARGLVVCLRISGKLALFWSTACWYPLERNGLRAPRATYDCCCKESRESSRASRGRLEAYTSASVWSHLRLRWDFSSSLGELVARLVNETSVVCDTHIAEVTSSASKDWDLKSRVIFHVLCSTESSGTAFWADTDHPGWSLDPYC